MFSSMRALIALIAMMLAMSGCGDLLGKKVVKRDLDGSQFEVNCELELDQFSQILNRNISSQIRCLGENLNFFIKIVKSGKPGYLSRVQLERYLADFRPDVKPEVIRALKAVFDLGHLITGDDPDYISKATVDKVIEFALVFNREAALHYGPMFQNESLASYDLHRNHRERVSNANLAIIQSFRNVFNYNRGTTIHTLNIVDLLKSFSTDSTADDIEKAIQVLFVKKLLIGGNEKEINNLELERLIMNFDHLVLIGLDLVRYKYIDLNQEYLLQMLKTDVSDLYNIITYGPLNNRDNEVIFKVEQAINAVSLYVPAADFDIMKYKNIITEVKKIGMKGDGENVKGIEIKNLFNHAKTVLQTGTVFHRIYAKFKEQMENPRPVEETIDFEEYRVSYPQHQQELNLFKRIAINYRFMRGTKPAPYYVRGSIRNAEGMFETYLWEYALKLVFAVYGQPSPANKPPTIGGYSMNQVQMRNLVNKFKKELEDLDQITRRRAVGTADNISLLGTLFQYQSDNNEVLDVNEASEFFTTLFTGISISEDIQNYLVKEGCSKDEHNRFDNECFKKKFWKGLCVQHKKSPTKVYSYRDHLPFLFQELEIPNDCNEIPEDVEGSKTKAMLEVAILAARSCNYYDQETTKKEPIPYSEGDIMSIMVAIMHAETTILRWDLNNNNIMDASEVDSAFSIYRGALNGFLIGKNPIIQKLVKQIYLYLIKYEEVPNEKEFKSVWKFVKFLISFKWKAPANRKTMVSILSVIGEETRKQQVADPTVPKFKCEWMRDPTTIPEEDEQPLIAKPLGADANMPATTQHVLSLSESMREKLKLELVEFVDDMLVKEVDSLRDIKQKNLRKFFQEIAKDPEQMREISAAVREGNEVQMIGFAVSAIFQEQFRMNETLPKF